MNGFPEYIDSIDRLEDVMTWPSEPLIDYISNLSGRLVVLGAGGKMGPTLCVRAERAVAESGARLEIVAVSRFSDAEARGRLESKGVTTMSCDILDPVQVAELPDADYVIFLVGWKFGTADKPGRTWTVNTLAPSIAMMRYPDAKVVALSSGNVYPMVSPDCGGANETYQPGPIGEYAWSTLGRERVFEHWADVNATSTALIRLNYAVDLRYGVLVDIASTIAAGRPVDLSTGYLNCVWQGDANDLIIRSLSLTEVPAAPLNLTGTETLQVRALAERLGSYMEMPVEFAGEEAPTGLLNDSSLLHSLLGTPEVPIDTLLRWTAHWIKQGLPLLGKPTHFDVRDGQF